MKTSIVVLQQCDYEFVLKVDNVLTQYVEAINGFYYSAPLSVYNNPNWCNWLIVVKDDQQEKELLRQLALVGKARTIRYAALTSGYTLRGTYAISGWGS